MRKEIERVVATTETEEFNSNDNHAIRAAEFDIMTDENGYEFMTPVSAPSTIILAPGEDPSKFTGFRCLNGAIVTAQMGVKVKTEERKIPIITGRL